MPQSLTHPAKPFLKWAGGKTQLLAQFAACYPPGLADGTLTKYFEPFIGSGAVFWDIVQKYPLQKAYLSDINPELILVYQVVKRDVTALIEHLNTLKQDYLPLPEAERQAFFYQVREEYNAQRHTLDFNTYSAAWIARAAQMIFLNKTCFNGLFRLNRRGGFNVPFGRYKAPKIFDPDNLQKVSTLLEKVEIHCGEFDIFTPEIDAQSFVYFDPPYRPLSKTSSFTAYSCYAFDDSHQTALAHYFHRLHRENSACLMLSNSDPMSVDARDVFFENLYQSYTIRRVYAGRMINSNAAKRGKIPELLITNY